MRPGCGLLLKHVSIQALKACDRPEGSTGCVVGGQPPEAGAGGARGERGVGMWQLRFGSCVVACTARSGVAVKHVHTRESATLAA